MPSKKNPFTQKEYVSIFNALVRLYGILNSDDIYEIIRIYHPEILKKHLYEALKKFYTVENQRALFDVVVTTNNKYVIASKLFNRDFETYDELVKSKEGKPTYLPNTFTELLFHQDLDYWYLVNHEALEKILTIFWKKPLSTKKMYKIYNLIFVCTSNNFKLQQLVDNIHDLGGQVQKESDVMEFANEYMSVVNNTRMPINNGFCPSELRRSAEGGFDHIPWELDPYVVDMYLVKEMNLYDYLEELKQSTFIPKEYHDDMIKEFEDILKNHPPFDA